jgi:hypothetical protein
MCLIEKVNSIIEEDTFSFMKILTDNSCRYVSALSQITFTREGGREGGREREIPQQRD